jgi:hypothetical protein
MIPFCGRPVALPEASLLQNDRHVVGLFAFSHKGPANESLSVSYSVH